jgi:hypothetical protein
LTYQRTLEENIARGKEIYRLRTEEKLSLQAIGDSYGLSRERVRQILCKYERVYLRREQLVRGEFRVVVMGDLGGAGAQPRLANHPYCGAAKLPRPIVY